MMPTRRVRHLNPAELGATVALDARWITGKADGDRVATWAGRVGTSNDAAAITTGPTYKVGIQAGLPVLRFAPFAANDPSHAMTIASVFAAQPYTIIMLSSYTSAGTGRILGGIGQNWLMGGWSGSTNSMYAQGFVSMGDGAGADFRIHTCRMSGGQGSYWVNGVAKGVNVSAPGAPGGLSPGGGGDSPEYGTGDMAVLIGFPSAMSDGLCRRIEQSIAYSFRLPLS